jgi:hypothetical protein
MLNLSRFDQNTMNVQQHKSHGQYQMKTVSARVLYVRCKCQYDVKLRVRYIAARRHELTVSIEQTDRQVKLRTVSMQLVYPSEPFR